MKTRSFLIYLATSLALVTHPVVAQVADEKQLNEFANTVFKKHHFEKFVLDYLGVGHTKGRMASMEDAYCFKNGVEKGAMRNLLLQGGTFDAEITEIVKSSNLLVSVQEWAIKHELQQLNSSERAQLLEIPSNYTSDKIVAQWLWSRFDNFGGNQQLNAVAKKSWDAICSKRKKTDG